MQHILNKNEARDKKKKKKKKLVLKSLIFLFEISLGDWWHEQIISNQKKKKQI